MVKQRFTILGSGSSGGVPRVGGEWGACDPDDPKNRRRRCALLVEQSANGRFGHDDPVTRILVDTTPDMREQLLGADIATLDAILITHEHADHIHGIDDVRPIVLRRGKPLDVFTDQSTAEILRTRFAYCFSAPVGSIYPPILTLNTFADDEKVHVDGPGGTIEAKGIPLIHGPIRALAYRFGDVAYAPDLSDIPEGSRDAFQNLKLWIIDALRYRKHVSHLTVDQALEWIAHFKPDRAVLTNLHVDLDYQELSKLIPEDVEPAYDGWTITMDADQLSVRQTTQAQ